MQTTTDRAQPLRLVTPDRTPTERWMSAVRRESPFGLVRVAADGPSVPLRHASRREQAAA
jgi:hypothetical protein